MRALARITTALATASVALTLAAPGAQALDLATDAPVVTNDSIEVYPFGMAVIDVLANDVDPGDPDGSQLALCRLPAVDLDSISNPSDLPPVVAGDAAGFLGPEDSMMVLAMRGRLAQPVVVDYYVCNTTYLTPATLTVTMRTTEPVTVHKVPGKPGRLRVTNHNDKQVRWMWFGRHGGGGGSVPAHATRTMRVHTATVRWMAMIGGAYNSGLADRGVVRNVKIDPRDAKPAKPAKGEQRLPA
ncbi:hypothetical protein ACFP8W_24290, partial [Nocardioides hankookensis]